MILIAVVWEGQIEEKKGVVEKWVAKNKNAGGKNTSKGGANGDGWGEIRCMHLWKNYPYTRDMNVMRS